MRLLKKESLMIAFRVSQSIFSIRSDGIVDDKKYLSYRLNGGHAVSLIGYVYIDGKLYWEMQNSWGKYWGNEGFFFMSDDLLRDIILDKVYVLVTSVDHQRELENHKKELQKMNIFEKVIHKIKKFFKKVF